MTFGWLKRFVPRGLYGRAALILVVPIVVLQLVVSAAILQRYFEEVAQQLSAGAALELSLVLDQIEADGPFKRTARALGITILDAVPDVASDRRNFYDLTGLEVIRTLRQRLPQLLAVDLQTDRRQPVIILQGADGPVAMSVQRRRLSAANPHQLPVVMVLAGALMTYVAYVFLRNQLRPIRRLSLAAEAFGKGRIQPYSPAGATEVRSAGRAFLDMRARIESMIEQRTLMLSGVSHDLRTPLTRMRLGLSMMEPAPEVDALLRDVEEMQDLLTTFLDFARGEALDDPEPVDPVALAGRLVEDARRGGGDVTLVTPPQEAPSAMLRPQALRRCLGNLINNGIRYGTSVRVAVALPERAVRFTIEDDGPGIALERRAEAFKPFARLDAARNQDKGTGVGLGLAIARDIVQRHGGTITLGDSADLGGLRIDVVLPR